MRLLLSLLLMVSSLPLLAAPQLDKLTLPKGFHIALYTDHVPDAREIALGTNGTVFVGSTDAGKVYALTDSDGDGVADKVRVVASGLQLPMGVAFHQGDLYISAVSRIVVLRDIEHHLDTPPKPELITDKLTRETHHGGKFLAFGPDGKLYVPIGAPCNICDPAPDHGKLTRMNADGSGMEDVARGIRNTVGFDWQPGTKRLWFTDNGRDLLGDDIPSDELNEITKAGEHFGYPYCHQGDTLDPEFGKGKNCKDYVPPVLKLGAHVASLGMRFYAGKQFPASYKGAIIVAEHGSWNRTRKSGYRVMTVRLNGSKVVSYEPLITGFEQDESAWGRPVDVQPLPDGSVLVSDDLAGAVYRVTYKP
ncbi:sorbosone dehydrogenase family protein [Rhodanobacter glycinis]|uniref:Sorbosone dehydrogenase family protein n=1 Tax=Rhodanobacter glycinis TaxID=582702 RepID=A0A502CA28_9GAMM|nr:PQQ-dependent sugar dehydrogenase [Rhodanobacter glycinis]TPG09788.1 sorbosone dehydrogenase family protein [Rhodanobacter glycinis]